MPRITRMPSFALLTTLIGVATACTGARAQRPPCAGKPAFDAYEATLIGQITLPH